MARSSKIASADDNTIIIWDADTGEQKTQLKGHTGEVMSVVWSPEASKIASGSRDKTIIIWDTVTGKQKSQLKGHIDYVESVAWSPEGSKIVSGGGEAEEFGEIIIWDAETGEQKYQREGHTDLVKSVVWSPEGSKIASASLDKTIIVWDAETGEQKTQLKGHIWGVTSVAWSPEGSKIASGSSDKTIIIWDAATGIQKSQLKGHGDIVSSVAWNSDGRKVASGSRDQTVIIWDVMTAKQDSRIRRHTGEVSSVTWSGGGSKVVSGSDDKIIIVSNAKTGAQISQLKGHTSGVRSVACSPEESSIAMDAKNKMPIISAPPVGILNRDHLAASSAPQVTQTSEQTLASSSFRRLYDDQAVPKYQHEIISAVFGLITAHCQREGLPAEVGEKWFKELEQEAFEKPDELLGQVCSAAQRLWTSDKKLQVGPTRKQPELCFIINESIRLDREAALKHTVVLVRAVNEMCVVRGVRGDKVVTFPPGGVLWRGGALPDEHKDFFATGRQYRVPGLLATSMMERATDLFVYRAYDRGQPAVRWRVELDPRGEEDIRYRCKHVNYVESSHFAGVEGEYLFAPYSVFTVREVLWSAKADDMEPHIVTLTAAVDNRKESEDLPLAPWY